MTEHKEVCLSINGEQSIRLEKGIIDFKNCFKQIPLLFKVYADFECNLESADSFESSYIKNIKIAFLVVLLTNLFVLMINLVNQFLFSKVRGLLLNSLKQFLIVLFVEYQYCKK